MDSIYTNFFTASFLLLKPGKHMQFNLFPSASLPPPSWSWELFTLGADNEFGDTHRTGSEWNLGEPRLLWLLWTSCMYPGLMHAMGNALERADAIISISPINNPFYLQIIIAIPPLNGILPHFKLYNSLEQWWWETKEIIISTRTSFPQEWRKCSFSFYKCYIKSWLQNTSTIWSCHPYNYMFLSSKVKASDGVPLYTRVFT